MRLRERLAEPRSVLAALVAAQWIAVGVFALTVERNGWLFYQGGDQSWFYTSGWILAGGHVPETYVGWVWAVVMAPVAALAGPSFLAGVPGVVLLQFLLLLPLGLLCVYGIASRIGGRLLGYWAAAWWIAIPYAIIPFFVERYHDTFVEQALPQGLGLTGLGDFPSMIAVLASAYFAVRAVETGASADAVAAGLLAGLAIGIKPANGLFAFAPLVALALARRWRRGVELAAAMLPGVIVLALWKHRGSGIALLSLEAAQLAAAAAPSTDFTPPTFSERVRSYVPFDHDQLNYQFLGFREYFWSARVVEYLPVAGAIAVARRSVPVSGLLATWLAAFFVVKASSPAVNVETGSIWRLLMPAWPAYFLLAAAVPLLIPRWGAALADRFAVPATALRADRRALAAALAVVFAIPLAAFAVLPSDDTKRATKMPLNSLFLPVDPAFRLEATPREDGSLDIRAGEGRRTSARPFYVLLRSPREYRFPATDELVVQGLLCRTPGGAIRCSVEMEEVARSRSAVIRDTPEPGRWTYRMGLAANWRDDLEAGDILLLSEPLDVEAR